MQPLIAISVGEIINYERGEAWTPIMYGQFRTYTDAVVRAGGAPFMIPLVDDTKILRKLYDQSAALLLSGGDDVAAATKSQASSASRLKFHTSPARDQQEMQLLRWALEDNKPVLGICRGMQLLNVVLGGDLYQDIEAELPASLNHVVNIDKKDFGHPAHRLEIAPGSRLAAILGKRQVPTNSLHHQAVRRLGKGLVVTARTTDGVIEAVELPDKEFVIGVQSHPEALEAEVDQLWRKLFRAFVRSAA